MNYRIEAETAKQPETPAHPAVGMLMRSGATVYYAHFRGMYVESLQLRAIETLFEGAAQ